MKDPRLFTSQDIMKLHELRKKTCLCKKSFLWWHYHNEDCPYRIQAEKDYEFLEKGGEDKA